MGKWHSILVQSLMILYPFHTDIVSDFCQTSATWWAKIPGTLNEKGKPKHRYKKGKHVKKYTPCSCEPYLHLEMGVNY